jgi:Fe-S-cluster containining protein
MIAIMARSMTISKTGDSICMGCGFCCGGWLHDQVVLGEDDDAAGLAAKGVDLFDLGQKKGFALPCTQLVGGCCAVYAVRPAMCRAYRCKLLQRHDRGEVTTAQAKSLIDAIHAFDAPGTIRPGLKALTGGRGRSLSELLALAHQGIAGSEDPAMLRKRHGSLLLRAINLIRLLQRDFFTTGQGQAELFRPDIKGKTDPLRG